MSNYEVRITTDVDIKALDDAQKKLNRLAGEDYKLRLSIDTNSLKNIDQFGKQFKNQFQNIGQNAGNSLGNGVNRELLKIQRNLNNLKFESIESKMNSQISKYKNQSGNSMLNIARSAQQEYSNSLKELKSLTSQGFDINDEQIVVAFNNMTNASERFKNAMSAVKVEMTNTIDSEKAETAANNVRKYYNENTKALKKYGSELEKVESQFRKATTQGEYNSAMQQFRKIQSQINADGLTGKSQIDEFKRAATQIGEFVGIYGILQSVVMDGSRNMVQSVIDVNDAVTDLRMATSMSNEEAYKMMDSYYKLGDKLKATGTDIAKSSTEWLKQGKTLSEASKLTEDAIVLSKIGDLSSEDATKTITAYMKSYDVAEKDVMDFVDKISAIDMDSATDVGGLSDAFNKVAANARNAGVEAEKVLAYAAAIGETTQEGMDSVGTSLNAIFSRMGNIKLSRLEDPETGEDLSNVETSLGNVGIKLRKSTNEFREFDDVLAETAHRWDSFSEVTQRSIASSFAG